MCEHLTAESLPSMALAKAMQVIVILLESLRR
jgi:hypothetical protein